MIIKGSADVEIRWLSPFFPLIGDMFMFKILAITTIVLVTISNLDFMIFVIQYIFGIESEMYFFEQKFNIVEAFFWMAMSWIAVLYSYKKSDWYMLSLSWVLFLFGFSDVIESQTGAWWEPWWLLVWKACCIISISALFWLIMKKRKQIKTEAVCEEGNGDK